MIKEKAVSNYLTFYDFNSKYLKGIIQKDEASAKFFKKRKAQIPTLSKTNHRLAIAKISLEVFEFYVLRLVEFIKIRTNLKNKLIINYWKNKKPYYCGCNPNLMCFNKKNGIWCSQQP